MFGLLSVCLTGCLFAAPVTLDMQEGEKWWGLATGYGRQMPFDAGSDLTVDLRTDIGQSCAPLLVSNRGRVLWCERPLCVTFAKGRMSVDAGDAEVVVEQGGTTLREAFRHASKRFFPPSGAPDLVFFDSPQLNTWIELTYNQNEKDILAYAESMVRNGVKPGIFMIDDTWQLGYGTWEFDPRRFPDPKGMCDKLHRMGFTVMLWMCPWVSPDTPAYRAIANYGPFRGPGGFLLDKDGEPFLDAWWNGKSALVDMTHPKGREWMEGQLARLVKEYGADGFKLDGGASYHYAREGMFAYDKAATPPDQTRAWDLLTEKFPKSDCCHLWKMGGRKIVTRLHDKNHSWDDLRRIIPDLIACGMVGTPFVCPDMIGGGQFASFLPGSPFEEDLFVRSCQVHVFAPMMQFSASPWRVLSPANQEIIRKMLALRKRFQLRINLQALEAGRTGEPMLRSMEYQFPDQGYAAIKDQFMMGDFLLVAPQLVKGAATRAVAIPPGRWVSDEGELVIGPKTVTVKTPLDRLPFFLRNSPAAETSAKADGVTIDTKLPGGNAIIEKLEGNKVILKQDLRDCSAPWFHWAVRVLGAGGRRLDFEFTDMRALSNRGAAYSLDKGRTWKWTHDREPENAHKFSFDFPKGADEVWFRQQIPYTVGNWNEFLARHLSQKDFVRTGVLAKTRFGNSAITAEIGKLSLPRYRVMLTSRHHAQETTGTWVMEGILEAALGDDDLGKWFRENVSIRAVPFVDTDGVLNGDQGKARYPHDHNRDYSSKGEELYPEVKAIEALTKVEKPNMLMDIHSPWIGGPKRWESTFYQVGEIAPGAWEQQKAFARLLAQGKSGLYRLGDDIAPGEAWNGSSTTTANKDPRTSTGWWRTVLPESFTTSFEIPFANARERTLGPDDWKAFGRDVAAAIRQWLEK